MVTTTTHPLPIVELASLTKGRYFYLPDDVRLERQVLSNRVWLYIFRHDTLAELGRLYMLADRNDCLNFVVKVTGNPNEPISQQRRAILEPIAAHVLKVLKSVLGGEDNARKDSERSAVECHDIPCAHCGAIVALVISAYEVLYPDELAACGEIFWARITELNVPTWVIGDETEIKMGSYVTTKFLVLKLWPNRVKAKEMLAISLKAKLDKLIQGHCANRGS